VQQAVLCDRGAEHEQLFVSHPAGFSCPTRPARGARLVGAWAAYKEASTRFVNARNKRNDAWAASVA
jgi:hypothetical protein